MRLDGLPQVMPYPRGQPAGAKGAADVEQPAGRQRRRAQPADGHRARAVHTQEEDVGARCARQGVPRNG